MWASSMQVGLKHTYAHNWAVLGVWASRHIVKMEKQATQPPCRCQLKCWLAVAAQSANSTGEPP